MAPTSLSVNGGTVSVAVDDPDMPLLYVLRNELGLGEPRYYKLPWDKNVARELQNAIDENERQHGSGVGVGQPFERRWGREDPKFYARPQPKLPDKPGQRPPVTVYQAPEPGI